MIVSRDDAIRLGQKWYFTGVPCPHGHVAKRTVSNRDCRECVNARNRRRRAIDPASFRAREKVRRDRDPAAYAELQRKRRLRYLDARRAAGRKRYHEHPGYKERQKKQAAEWWRKNPGKRNKIVAARRSWIKRATPPWLTAEHHAEIAAIYIEAARRGESVDHIHPLRGKTCCGLHVPWNLQIIPLADNIRKGNRFEITE